MRGLFAEPTPHPAPSADGLLNWLPSGEHPAAPRCGPPPVKTGIQGNHFRRPRGIQLGQGAADRQYTKFLPRQAPVMPTMSAAPLLVLAQCTSAARPFTGNLTAPVQLPSRALSGS